MSDFVSIKGILLSEKERLEKLEQNIHQKLNNVISEIEKSKDFLNSSEIHFQNLEKNLNERKKEEIEFQNQKKELLQSIDSLKDQIKHAELSIRDEEEKISKLTSEVKELSSSVASKQNALKTTEENLVQTKENIKVKIKEKEDVTSRMQTKMNDSQQNLSELQLEKEKDTQISPILDFLLKEVRIDIPEVEILSTLAYRKQAMGLEELKKAVSKTPPVIILKVIRNLDSKGIIKYDERLDTIEIIAKLV